MASKELTSDHSASSNVPLAPILAAWLIPGGGHLWQRRWGRGTLLLVSITALFLLGVGMQGRLFKPMPSDIVETLGFLGDFCSGLLFMAAKFFGYDPVFGRNNPLPGVGQMASPIADYGTKFLLVAGLLNVLCILDAYDIAIGKKS